MIGVMFYLDLWLAIACMVPIALGILVQYKMMTALGGQENVKKYYDSLEQLNASAVQYVRGMPAIKVFGQTVRSFRKFYNDMLNYQEYCVKFTDQMQNGYLGFKILLSSFAAFILPVGVLIFSQDPGDIAFASVLLFFLIMAPGVSAPMFKILFLTSLLRDIHEGVDRMDRILMEQPVAEPKQPKKPESYDVLFDNISFAYGPEPSCEKVISGVTLLASQGEVTALVGPSGAGKSTLANLVPRFWDVTEGAIRIGGVDIRDMSTEDLMNKVGFVFQETFLFFDTVYNNIAVGCPYATREDVIAAAKAAQCHEFIQQLPHGYDTRIGEGGVYLSGGEEQRVAVARAILKNAPILVLDEATAFADPENEYEMQRALKALTKGKTVIIIAHRLSTIQDAEQIVVLDQGRIVAKGKHEELIAEAGLYAKMWHAYTDSTHWQLGNEKGGSIPHEHVASFYGR